MDLYDELLELVLAYSNNKVKYLAKWIIDYRKADNKKEAELRLEKLLYLNRFRRMAEAYALAKPKERASRNPELFEYYSAFIKPMIPNRHRFAIDEFCYKGQWQEAADSIAEIDGEIEANRYESEYERLVTDTEYLIGQLVLVMKTEYGKRLESAKKAMSEYIAPHRTVLERLDRNLLEANEALKRVERSELPPDDKAELAMALRDRAREMEGIGSRETGNMRNIKAFVDDIKKTYLVFESVISSIERKKEQIDERRNYAGLMKKLEIETSEMNGLFSGLNAELNKNLGKAKESMELLTSTFQDKIVDIINDQEKVNRLLEAERAKEEEGEGRERAVNREYYEDILKILKSMNN